MAATGEIARKTSPSSNGANRRVRKKLRTRDALADTAIGLFAVNGFEDTTIEAIADVVDVSRRTFHRYFPCKEDVLFADAADRLALFRAALDEQPLDEPVLISVRAAVRALAAELSARPETELTRLQLIESTPALRAQHLRYQEELAAAVTDFAARRAEPETDPAWPALLGACTVAVLSAMRRHWTAGDAEGTLADVLDHGFDLLAGLAKPATGGQLADPAAGTEPAPGAQSPQSAEPPESAQRTTNAEPTENGTR